MSRLCISLWSAVLRAARAGPTPFSRSAGAAGTGPGPAPFAGGSCAGSAPPSALTTPPAGECPTLSRDPTLAWAFSLKFSFWFSILTSPPPGLCLMFALDPHLEDTLERSTFLFWICTFPPPGTCLILSLEPHLD